MSLILSDEKQMIMTKIKKKVLGVCCDICTKELLVDPNKPYNSTRYFEVMTGHHDWGTDSCESIEHRDICPECINDFVRDYLAEADGTEYIEIETEYIGRDQYEYEEVHNKV